MKEKINELIDALNYFKRIMEVKSYCTYNDMKDTCNAFKKVRNIGSKVITTGMGKAGLAAQYLSDGLCSIGVPAVFLHPGDAQHGNLGIVSNHDVLVVFSNSGQTREVVELVDLIKNLYMSHPPMVIMISGAENILTDVDRFIWIGDQIELIQGIPVPTSSTLVMMAVSMLLIAGTAEQIQLTREQYFQYHHGGYIGTLKDKK